MSTAFAHDLSLGSRAAKLRAVTEKQIGTVRGQIKRGRRCWRIDLSPAIRGHGRWVYGTVGHGFRSRKEAQTVLEYIRADAPRMGWVDAANQFRRTWVQQNTIAACGEIWLREASRTIAPHTLHGYQAVLRTHLGFWAGLGIQDVTTANVRDWIAELAGKGLKPKTISNALRVLKQIVRRYREDHPWVSEPVWPRIKVPRELQPRMPIEDIVATLDAVPEPAAGIFFCAFYTASRPNEVRGALIQDYDFKTGKLTICRALKTDSGVNPHPGGPKTGESGVYVVPGELGDWLLKWRGGARLQREEPLFPHPTTGAAWESKRMRLAWRKACERAGVEYVPLYRALKHSPVTALLEAGASLEDVQALCRHRRKSTTERYDLSNDERRARGSELLADLVGNQRGTQRKTANSGSPATEGHEKGKKR